MKSLGSNTQCSKQRCSSILFNGQWFLVDYNFVGYEGVFWFLMVLKGPGMATSDLGREIDS